MTLDYIATLSNTGESETLEFTATTGTRSEAVMTVCAFVDRRGGQVLVDVTLTEAVIGGGGCAD